MLCHCAIEHNGYYMARRFSHSLPGFFFFAAGKEILVYVSLLRYALLLHKSREKYQICLCLVGFLAPWTPRLRAHNKPILFSSFIKVVFQVSGWTIDRVNGNFRVVQDASEIMEVRSLRMLSSGGRWVVGTRVDKKVDCSKDNLDDEEKLQSRIASKNPGTFCGKKRKTLFGRPNYAPLLV